MLPAFVLNESCPIAVVREFLGGLFGADGHAPTLHRWGKSEDDATLNAPAYSQSTIPEHVSALKQVMDDVIHLLTRCGVKTNGANVYEYPTRHASSSYPTAQDGLPGAFRRSLVCGARGIPLLYGQVLACECGGGILASSGPDSSATPLDVRSSTGTTPCRLQAIILSCS